MHSTHNVGRFIFATFITYLGTGIQILGAAYVSFLVTGSIFSIGGVFLAYAIPQVLSSYFIPGLIGRYGVKSICIWSDYIRAALMLLLGIVVYLDIYVLVFTFLITVLSSMLDSFFVPSSNSFFQRILNDAKANANTASSRLETITQLAMLLSVTLGALLVDRLGEHYIFLLNAVSFLLSGIILSTIAVSFGSSESVQMKSNPLSIYIRCFSQYRSDVINFSLARIIPNVMNTVTTYFIVKSLGKSFLTLGLVDAIASIGFAAGAWLYPHLLKKYNSDKIMIVSLSSTAIMIYFQPLYGLLMLGFTFFVATLTFGVSRVAARAAIIKSYDDSTAEIIYTTSNLFGMLVAIGLTIGVCYTEALLNIQLAYAVVATFLLLTSIYILISERIVSKKTGFV